VIGGRTQSSEQVINAFGAVIASRIPPGTQINYVPSNINIEDVFNDFERMLSQTGSHSVTTNKPLAVSASKKVTPFGIRQQHSRHKKNND
jgi:ribosomal protein L5